MTIPKSYPAPPVVTPQADPLVPPVLTSLEPASAVLGSPDFTIHVMGTGFIDGTDTILWNGAPEPTTFVSETELTTGVNMATAINAVPCAVTVQRATGETSNALTFTFEEEPELPEVEVPDGWVALKDAWHRPLLLRAEEVAGIEERWDEADSKGPLYGQSPAGPYRRLTLRGGSQFFIASPGSVPLLAALGG